MKPFYTTAHTKLHPLTLAITLLLAQPTHVVFAETNDSETVLDTVIVSGSRAATKLSDTPQSIGLVKKEAIKRDQPKTMGEIINRIPGVYWNELGNEQHSMGIRQPISTNAVYQYLEDGIPIRPLGVFNHNALNEINMASTDSVEVVKGAASSLYGSNAVAGAVNFLTAAPSRTPYVSLGIRHDNTAGFTRYDSAFSNTWEKIGLRFSHYSSRRNTNNWQEYSRGNKDSFTLRGDYALSNSSQLRATLVHTDLDTAMTGSLFENDYRDNPGKSINTFTYRKDKMTRANFTWEGETTANGITTATIFYRNNDHGQIPSYTIRNCIAAKCAGTINNNHVESLGIDVKHQQEFSWLNSRLVTGVYIDNSDNPYVSDNLAITRDPISGKYLSYSISNNTNPLGVRNYQTNIRNTATFAQWEFSPLEKIRVVAGGRFDAIQYDYTNNIAPTGSKNYGAPNESRHFSKFSPKIGATYTVSKNANFYSNVSQGFTPPEVSQLYGATGIPNLKPATYNNYEIGMRLAFLGGALKLDSALYRLDGKDTIVSYTIAPGNSENRNAGRTRSQGLEIGLNYDAGIWDARFGTTIAKHRFLKYQTSGTLDYSGKTMPQAPSNITNVEIGYKPTTKSRVALEAVHLGSYQMNNANTVKYPGHLLFNMRSSYQLAKGWKVWLQARNLTNKRHADSASSAYSGVGVYSPNTQNQYTPGTPRTVMLGLTYSFDQGKQ